MLRGRTKATICLLTDKDNGQIMQPRDLISPGSVDSPTVFDVLRNKHPLSQLCTADSLVSPGLDPTAVHPIIYEAVNACCIRSAALHIFGAGGPSCDDAHCWRRLCTAFKRTSDDLCHSLSMVARRLCSHFVDPICLSSFLACHLVALNKNPGVRWIGICKTVRRIIAKSVLSITSHQLSPTMCWTENWCGGWYSRCTISLQWGVTWRSPSSWCL